MRKSLFRHVWHTPVTYLFNMFPYPKEDAAFRNRFHEPPQYHRKYKIPIIMPVNKPGFKITAYCGCVPLSCLFGNWIQSPLSAGSTPSLTVVALNRQRQQKNVSILLILRSCFIISAQLMELDCGCFFFFVCVCHFNPPLNHRRKRKTSSTGGKRTTFFFFFLFSPPPIYWEVQENTSSFSVPQETEGFWKGKMKGEKWLVIMETETDRQHEPMRWQTGRVFEVFLSILCFRSCLS